MGGSAVKGSAEGTVGGLMDPDGMNMPYGGALSLGVSEEKAPKRSQTSVSIHTQNLPPLLSPLARILASPAFLLFSKPSAGIPVFPAIRMESWITWGWCGGDCVGGS